MSIETSLIARAAPYQTWRFLVVKTVGSSAGGFSTSSRSSEALMAGAGLMRGWRRSSGRHSASPAAHARRGCGTGSSITSEAIADHDGGAVHREQEDHQDQDPSRDDDLELTIRLLGVIVDLHGQGGVTIERSPREPEDRPGRSHQEQGGGLADRPREAEDCAGEDAGQGGGDHV